MTLPDRLRRLFREAVALCDPERLTGAALVRDGDLLEVVRHRYTTAQAADGGPTPRLARVDEGGSTLGLSLQGGRVAVLCAGKAAVGQATAIHAALRDRIDRGLVVVPADAAIDAGAPAPLSVLRASHPLPDAASVQAARAALELAGSLGIDDVLVCGISGGTSALLALPAEGLSLADKEATTRLLLTSGADIGEINAVRKHLSRIKGGRLATATRASILGLLLSDVAGDPPDVVGSGPVSPDPTTFADALAVLDRRGIAEAVPSSVRAHLEAGRRGEIDETPKGDDAVFARCKTLVIAGPEHLRSAAVALAARSGFAGAGTEPASAGMPAEELAKRIGACARGARERPRRPGAENAPGGATATSKPSIFVWVREPSVAVAGSGRGGRNGHLALAVAKEIAGLPGVAFLSAGSDGIDGDTRAAGAVVDGETWSRALSAGLEPARALATFDSGPFHEAAGTAIVTGRTGTNFMDLQLLAVE